MAAVIVPSHLPGEEIVANRLLTSIDRSLLQRARTNAADAVRTDARNAAQRREAVTALLAQPDVRLPTSTR